MNGQRERGSFLTVMAVLYGLLTVSNATKFIQYLTDPTVGGIVIFGVRAASVFGNLVFGLLLALVTGAYCYGLWKLKAWVAPLSIAYAFYVPVNLVLFWFRHTEIGPNRPSVFFLLIYLAIALTGSVGTALYLAYHRDKLQ